MNQHIDALITKLEDTTDWRRSKAEEYPDDGRNADAVKTLSDLRTELEAADQDNSSVQKYIHECGESCERGAAHDACRLEGEYISRIGFDSMPADADALLSDLSSLISKA